MDKEFLRKKARAERARLAESYCREAEVCIAQRFLEHFGGFRTYAMYSSIGNEVGTGIIAKALTARGRRLIYPRVFGNEFLWGEKDFKMGAFGILEPQDTVEFAADIVVIPAVLVDRSGYRLGYGKGYYDRFLEKHPLLFAVALAYSVQIVDSINPQTHDRAVCTIVTDKEILDFSGRCGQDARSLINGGRL